MKKERKHKRREEKRRRKEEKKRKKLEGKKKKKRKREEREEDMDESRRDYDQNNDADDEPNTFTDASNTNTSNGKLEEDAERQEDEESVYDYEIEHATKEEFETFRSDVLAKVPDTIKKRFREGGFSKWGKDWLPVLEIGPFDVEPGPVRTMWMEMFQNVSFGSDST